MKRFSRLLAILALSVLAIFGSQAFPSQAYNAIGTIAVPPGGLASSDIFWGDASLGRAFLGDRTNGGVDVFDMRANAFLGRIPTGGTGTAGAPNGVATDAANHLVFAGLGAKGAGDGFLVANATTLAPITTLSIPKPGGGTATGRSDELAVAPNLNLIVIANDQDLPPFVTELSYTPAGSLRVIQQIALPQQAACGIEQTVWVPQTQQFMTALPTAGGCPGGIAVFDANLFNLVRTIPTDCSPAGMALANYPLMFVGCTPAPEVIDVSSTGVKVATLGTLPSSDEVWFDRGANAYEFLIGAPANTLNIFSAATNTLIESDPTGGAFHNLTADAATLKVFVADQAGNTTCPKGCIAVFGPPARVSNLPPVGVSCGGVFNPDAMFCGGPPVPLGVTCNGLFYPNAIFCGS